MLDKINANNEKTTNLKNTAISCMSGGYKTVFAHGVLTAFEDRSMFADTYAVCSDRYVCLR